VIERPHETYRLLVWVRCSALFQVDVGIRVDRDRECDFLGCSFIAEFERWPDKQVCFVHEAVVLQLYIRHVERRLKHAGNQSYQNPC
jgi:hypothetical protein